MSGLVNAEKVEITVSLRPKLFAELQRELERVRTKEHEFSVHDLCSEIIEVWCAGRRVVGDENA